MYQYGSFLDTLLEAPISDELMQEMAADVVVQTPVAESEAMLAAEAALTNAGQDFNLTDHDSMVQHLASNTVALGHVGPMLSLLIEGDAELEALVAPGGGVVFQPQFPTVLGHNMLSEEDLLARLL